MAEEGGIKQVLYPLMIGVFLVGCVYFIWTGQETPIKEMPRVPTLPPRLGSGSGPAGWVEHRGQHRPPPSSGR